MANQNNYNRCSACPFFKNEDAEGRGWCDVLDTGIKVWNMCKVDRESLTDRGAAKVMHYYQKWRRGADIDMPSPRIIGLAEDRALKALRNQIKQNNK